MDWTSRLDWTAGAVTALVLTPLTIKFFWDERRQRLRRETGWKPWRVYGSSAGMKCGAFDFDKGNRGRFDFDNEDAAVRYAYRRKMGPTTRPITVYRGDQLIVGWRQGEVWNEDDGKGKVKVSNGDEGGGEALKTFVD
jgi:hypothetical protein